LPNKRNDTGLADALLDWAIQLDRPMPWRGINDPYRVWLSEVILQQTRVEQGMPYYIRFTEAYPTVHDLARAPIDDVMRIWQGLGYYSRARNLHSTAQYISTQLGGIFPTSYAGLIQLKGIGPYTAAAIASFIYDERVAVVDGNVVRVLARVYGIDEPFDTTIGKKKFRDTAEALISATQPGAYNQAIMDLGATVCTPRNPTCIDCPFSTSCQAYQTDTVAQYPVKGRKLVKRTRYFYYLYIIDRLDLWVSKRADKDIWQGLYELPLIETATPIGSNLHHTIETHLGVSCRSITTLNTYSQQLTHQSIEATFIAVEATDVSQATGLAKAQKVAVKKLSTLAFPKVVHLFLSDNSLL
jgi:A/G-specific adenine glycosylase